MIFNGKVNLFLGKNSAPNKDIKSISFFILLLFNDLSPIKFTLISGVVESIPINNLAKVPELPKFKVIFFSAK